ncbi:MAG TPA: sulfotransferase [Solirubrobacteraceae bacterium]|nr:sulfotransferase [Solirubrobacteraceae bacterium]
MITSRTKQYLGPKMNVDRDTSPAKVAADFEPEPAAKHSTKPKIIYVMGAGRSGSTIFGVALGNCGSIFDAGELEAWLRRSGVPNHGGAERARFWASVQDRVTGGADLFGDDAWRCLEHSSSLLRVDRWPRRRLLRNRYRQIAEELYRAVVEVSGTANIVDTSHYPLRVRELQALSNIDLYLIYLVRDAQDVVASFDRRNVDQEPKSPAATNLYLWMTHLLSVVIFLRHPRDRRLFVRHEDFMRSPERVLGDVLARIEVPAGVPDLTALRTGIPFQGNRLLRAEVLALRNDASPGKRRVTKLVQSPWTIVHSRLRPSASPSRASKRGAP